MTLNSPNPSLYAEDYKTCSKCGVRQTTDKLEQWLGPPSLKPGRPGALVKHGAGFRRLPDTPPEVESEAAKAARNAQPWVCRNGEACTLNRIRAAVAKFEETAPFTTVEQQAVKDSIDKELAEFEKMGARKKSGILKRLGMLNVSKKR